MTFNYREVEILSDQVVADAGTKTVDVKVTEPITELAVDIKVQNEAQTCQDVPAERIISKIEIVDGGTVYWSTTGAEAIAVSCYEKGRWPPVWLYEGTSGNQRAHIPLSFGRYLGDPNFAFSPHKLLNPQIRVTWTNDALHLTNQTELGIYAKLMQGIEPPRKALMTKGIRTFNTADSGVEPTDLPIDRPYRRLFIRMERAGYSITSIFSNYVLDCDLGKLIVFNLGQRDMVNRCESEFGFFTYRKHDFVENARYVRSWMGRTMAAQIQSIGTTGFTDAYTTSSDNYYALLYDQTLTPLADISLVAKVFGSFPQYTLCYQFGRKDKPGTWFDPKRFEHINLKLTQETDDATAAILLQQPRSLP